MVLWLRSSTSKAGGTGDPWSWTQIPHASQGSEKKKGGREQKMYHSIITEIVFIKHLADAEAQ